MDYKNLRTVGQIARRARNIITEGKLRWWIFQAKANGMAKAIVKIGGRVYIDKVEFNRWLEKKRLEKVSPDDESTT